MQARANDMGWQLMFTLVGLATVLGVVLLLALLPFVFMENYPPEMPQYIQESRNRMNQTLASIASIDGLIVATCGTDQAVLRDNCTAIRAAAEEQHLKLRLLANQQIENLTALSSLDPAQKQDLVNRLESLVRQAKAKTQRLFSEADREKQRKRGKLGFATAHSRARAPARGAFLMHQN